MRKLQHKYILNMSDIHCRLTVPRSRIDDYWESTKTKLRWLVWTANKYEACICCSGDLLDSAFVGMRLLNELADIFYKCKYKIYVIAGNHDMAHHSQNLITSPLSMLAKAGAITLLHNVEQDGIYGCSWDGPMPETDAPILMIHKQVWERKPPEHILGAVSADTMFSEYPSFRFILSGDNHVPFAIRHGNQLLLNSGTMMRDSKDIREFKPGAFLLDPASGKFKRYLVPIQPMNEVFNLKQIEFEENLKIITTKNTQELVATIQNTTAGPQFKPTLMALINKPEVSPETKAAVLKLSQV